MREVYIIQLINREKQYSTTFCYNSTERKKTGSFPISFTTFVSIAEFKTKSKAIEFLNNYKGVAKQKNYFQVIKVIKYD